MNAVRTAVLEKPATNYGAVLKPKYTPKSGYACIVFAVVLAALMITSPANTFLHIPGDEKSIGLMWILGSFAILLAGAGLADSRQRNEEEFYEEKKQKRYEYVTSTVREYIETIYDAKIDAKEMHWLWQGYDITIRVQGTYKKVKLEGSGTINDYATGRIKNFYPEDLALMEVIEPAKVSYREIPRAY